VTVEVAGQAVSELAVEDFPDGCRGGSRRFPRLRSSRQNAPRRLAEALAKSAPRTFLGIDVAPIYEMSAEVRRRARATVKGQASVSYANARAAAISASLEVAFAPRLRLWPPRLTISYMGANIYSEMSRAALFASALRQPPGHSV